MNASSVFSSRLRFFGLLLACAMLAACSTAPSGTATKTSVPADVTIAANDPAVRLSGRSEGAGTERVTFGWSGARMRLRFTGSASVAVRLEDESTNNYAAVWIDGVAQPKFRLDAADGIYRLADDLSDGEHTVEVVRLTEGHVGLTHFRGFVLAAGGTPLPWRETHARRIEFIGDSITCGYGVEVDDPKLHFEPATENFCLGYSGLTARTLDADYVVVSRSGIGMVRNYDGPRDGIPGDAVPAAYGRSLFLRPDSAWDFSRFTPDVVCVNLGTNDFSTSGVNVDLFVATYRTFVEQLLARYPKAQLVMLQGPMNTSPELRAALDRVRAQLSPEVAPRVHFLALTAQGSVGLGADYHPNRAQSEINARELTTYLRELMGWK
ncbi:MAG: SGNH/GDSL hydrolase family protein [Opitutaceae bacterium]|nr:SGNH/GDSL hydrolase family protein [Opitutaceae bacterium]